MGELKSAWEIALEKANKLGKLSAEEEQQQKEQNCRQIAQGLTQKCLNTDLQDISSEIGNYPTEERKLIKQAILYHLVEAIDLQNSAKLEKASQCIANIYPESQPILEQISQLFQEFKQSQGTLAQELQSNGKEMLHRLRISGTAVGDINMEVIHEWQQSQQSLVGAWQPKLASMKQTLLK